ncbi:hypothetical protein FALCPG4_007461 [Fusarium falciforme]
MAPHEDFSSKYTNANLAPGAAPYDTAKFCGLVKVLEGVDNGSISEVAPAIIAVILCGQKRGDIVPLLFRDLVSGKSDDEQRRLFMLLRHGITVAWPFFGLPSAMPACLGLVNELRRAEMVVAHGMERPSLGEVDWLAKGLETNKVIYRAAGNSEVGQMIGEFFPEISYVGNTVVFGFLIGGSQSIHRLPLTELIVASAIAGVGATRQARSHLKASIGLGISLKAIESVVVAVDEISAWNGARLLGNINVADLAKEAKANLEKHDQ